jgi:NADH-quinone oxidoreductase subunit F
MLGTKALQIFDETVCVARAVLRWTEFYKHESCGKCTHAAKEHGGWCRYLKIWRAAKAKRADLDKLLDLVRQHRRSFILRTR